MRKGFIASTVLGLGMAASLPSMARADDWRHFRDRDDDRWEHRDWDHDRYRSRDYVEDIGLGEVPGRVMDRVNDYRHGRRIEYAQLVHQRDYIFYRFRIDDREHGDFYLDIDPDGHLIRRINT